MPSPRHKTREPIDVILLASLHRFVWQQNVPIPTTLSGVQDSSASRITLSIALQYFYLKQTIDIRMRKEIDLRHMNIPHHRVQLLV